MIFDGPWDDDERYILDDRQLYFLKQAGERLSSQDFQDLKQENDDELRFYSCTVDGEPNRKKLPSSFLEVKVRVGRKLRSQIKQMVDDPDKLPGFGLRDYRGMNVTDYEYLSLLELPDEWLSNYLRYFMNYSGIHDDDVNVAASGRFKLVEIDNWKNVVPKYSEFSTVDLLQCDMNFLKAYIASIE